MSKAKSTSVQFRLELAALLEKYQADLSVEIYAGWDGGGVRSVEFQDQAGNVLFQIEDRSCVDSKDVREGLSEE